MFSGIHSKITTLVGSKYSTEVWWVVSSFSRAIRYKKRTIPCPMKGVKYSEANKKYNQKLSYNKMKGLIKILEKEGYLEEYRGYYFSDNNKEVTKIRMTRKLENMYDMDVAALKGLKRCYGDSVVVRDDNKNALSTRNLRGITKLRNTVDKYNTFLSKQNITALGVKADVSYRRVFSEDLSSGGRFYTVGGFQSIPSKFRPSIHINKESCTEVDICYEHPAIIACLSGKILPNDYDPYSANPSSVLGSDKEKRLFYKKSLLIMLYSGNKSGSYQAIESEYKNDAKLPEEDRKYATLSKVVGKNIVCELEQCNPWMVEHFYKKDSWKTLQFLDSCILEKVVIKLTESNIPCLLYHDSVVVAKNQTDLLENLFKESWVSVLQPLSALTSTEILSNLKTKSSW